MSVLHKDWMYVACADSDGGAGGGSGEAAAAPTGEIAAEKTGDESGKVPDINLGDSIAVAQGIEGISDDMLMGHDPEAEAAAAAAAEAGGEPGKKAEPEKAPAKPAEPEKTPEKAKEALKSPKKPEKPAEESKPAASKPKAGEEEGDPGRPPKGFVPLEALHEVRGENRFLKERIDDLERRLETRPAPSAEEGKKKSALPDDFEVLTDRQYEELAEDDPKGALRYMRNLNIYQEEQREAREAQQREKQRKIDEDANAEKLGEIFAETSRQMEEAVPGIFDEKSTASEELAEFAKGIGFTDDMYYLTNPETRVILPGETEPLFLGEQAAAIIRTLATARTRIAESKGDSVDKDALREEIKAELEPELRKTIEAELLKKFKAGPEGEQFRSLNQIPSSSETPAFEGETLSMEQMSQLSEKDQELYLSGRQS